MSFIFTNMFNLIKVTAWRTARLDRGHSHFAHGGNELLLQISVKWGRPEIHWLRQAITLTGLSPEPWAHIKKGPLFLIGLSSLTWLHCQQGKRLDQTSHRNVAIISRQENIFFRFLVFAGHRCDLWLVDIHNLKTVQNFSREFGYSTSYIYRLIKAEVLKSVSIDGVIFIDVSKLPVGFKKKAWFFCCI